MKKQFLSLLSGILIGATLFGGGVAMAASVVASPFADTGQRILLNGQEIQLAGYTINGNNYFKLRDIAAIIDFGVTWDGDTNAVLLDTTKGYTPEHQSSVISDNFVVLPADGSQYKPQAGDVILCNDGYEYTIADVSRWDANAFAEGPLPDLPVPVCDWSLLDQPALPAVEIRHFSLKTGEYLFIRNLYETRRMQYTLYNAIGNNPKTWQNEAPVLRADGTQLVRIELEIPDGVNSQSFWPWKEERLTNLFDSLPSGTYQLEAWDVYKDGIFQRTEYNVSIK